MPYIGKSPHFGVRNRFIYTATGDETSKSGADDSGATLTFTDGAYVDVYLNGVLLKPDTDYVTTTANTIGSLSALSTSDILEVIVYDVFSVSDTVSAASGGAFSGRVDFTGGVGGSGGNLVLKNTDTADDSFPTLTLQTGDTDIAVGDVLGRIAFQAPDEGAGTDAILVPVNIEAVSQGDFSSSNNATSLVINTSTTSAAGTAGDGGKFSFVGNGEFIVKSLATTDGNYPVLTMQTGETDIAQDDVIGQISFQAPDEGTGTDAILIAAGIQAISEGDFSSSSNATSLVFKTGSSEAATTKMTIDSAGNVKFASLQNLELTALNKVPHIKSTDQLTQLADDSWITVSNTDEPLQGLLIVTNYNTGHTGIFRHEYASSTTTLISGDSGQWANSDSDGYLCVYTGVNSYHVYIKNRQGAARDVKALFLGTYQ